MNKTAFRSLNEEEELSPYDKRAKEIINSIGGAGITYSLYAEDCNESDKDNYVDYYAIYYLQGQKAEEYGGLGHLNCAGFWRIDYYKPPNSQESKKYNFLVMDGSKARGLLKEKS